MRDISIKVKLILLFILIKVIPLLLIAFIAYEGALKLEEYVQKSTRFLFNKNKEIIINTANASIEDSVKNLDKKSQHALERLSYEIANNVADFLYERDKDLLFLSKININQDVLKNFYNSKQKDIIIHEDYTYDDKTNQWISIKEPNKIQRENTKAVLKDNEREFNYSDPLILEKKTLPIYKEINYFDLNGKELYKISSINQKLLDISVKTNTYINAETYFKKITKLKEGEIYVSDVIGEYVKSNVIGTFTKAKAEKMKVAFEPHKHAYAGKENPVGKKFEGIIRFVTPVFKDGVKTGYISLALNHEHIMQFTDTSNPTSVDAKQNISDASIGNYAFMWDYEGKNISHPRDYFIVGYDKNTGERVMPWLSLDVAKKYKDSNKEINEFLKEYPTFEEQTLKKKPNIPQLLKDGNIGLDCRYLNFAPQCQGWMQLTQNGGYGSFIIYWSKVWKLTTAAAIPYYTGKYSNSKRGFGFVTIGANVEEFHSAANETKRNVTKILNNQTEQMKEIVDENSFEIEEYIKSLVNELSVVTLIMLILVIAIAIWMSNYISGKIERLLIGTQKFSNNEFDYRINVKSNDEIGNLEKSFNTMASKIKSLINEQKELNEHLEEKVNEKTTELVEINKSLEEQIEQRTNYLKETLKKAQKADEAKSTFLANISHEIRTPLNAIIGFSDILSKTKGLDSQTTKQAKIIQSSANSLLAIINDILDISKIESGNFDVTIEETDIYFISEHVVELFSKRAAQKNIKMIFNLDHKIPLCILSDGVRIRQVLSNLLSNAIKFTPDNGCVYLNIYMNQTSTNNNSLRFEVIDTGIGIKENKLSTIFEPFIQIDNSTNRMYEGTGLGLSICSHILESLNSKIYVESKVDEGTKFWFDLEIQTCQQTLHNSKNYINHINFNVKDKNNELYKHIEKYLNIFGTINSNNTNNLDIMIYNAQEKNIDDIEKLREENKTIGKLILVEYEKETRKYDLLDNEIAIALPFYASKVNDALQDLLRKTNQQKEIIQDELTNKFDAKVLIAEDNIANQELISHIFSSMSIDFKIANNGLEAIEYRIKNSYDLIFMDINMPQVDGIEAFKQIREYETKNSLDNIPIIALTANAIKGDKEKFLELGMNDYLSKPINTNRLIDILTKYLNKKEDNTNESKEKKQEVNKEEKYSLDTQKIAKNLGVSENIAVMIVNKFKKSIYTDLDKLEEAIKNEDKEEIIQKAHYIKNSCLNIDLNNACKILEDLESNELNNNEQKNKFIELKKEIDRIK